MNSQSSPRAPLVADEMEVVELSPFEVNTSRDEGYTAASALAGGRTDTPLKNTPAVISVLTRDFLDDISANDFLKAAEWSVNAVPVYDAAESSLNGGYNVRFRGLSSSFPSRNYFSWGVDSDNYNTERLEFARGPNGVLFGDGSVGGITTVWTKRADLRRNRTVVNATVDSFGSLRFTADINRKLNDRVALRLNLLHDRSPGWRDNTKWEREGAHLAGTIKLTERNSFRFEGEYGQFDRQVSPTNYQDLSTNWDGVTTFNGTTTPITGRGIGRISTSAYFLDIPGIPSLGYQNWTNSYQTGGTAVAMEDVQRTDLQGNYINQFPVLPSREFNLAPPDSVAEIPYYSYSAYLDHKFTKDFFVELAFNQSQVQRDAPNTYLAFREYRIDVNQLLPNGQPNPKFLVPFSDRQRSRNTTDNFGNEVRLMAAWRRDFGWLNQGINFIGGSRGGDYFDIQDLVYRVNGTNPNITAAENQYRVRLYWDEPGAYSSGRELPNIPGYQFDWIPSAQTEQATRLNSAQVASKSQFFKDRLTVLLGGRHDDFHRELATLSGPRDAVTGRPSMSETSITDVEVTSYNAGAVYFPVSWLGVYGNYSETFAPPGAGANLLDGSAPGISRSSGYDGGVKLNLMGGRIVATANYYDSQQVEQLAYSSPQQSIINRIWANLGRNDQVIGAYRDTQDFKGRGVEFEVTANPTPSLRLMASYAVPKTEAVRLLPGLRSYFDANLATWQAGANDPANPNRVQIQSDIATVQAQLTNAVEGVALDNTLDYTVNAYGTYTFKNGWLKNLAVGSGANIRGKNKIGATLASPFDYVKAQAYYVVSSHLAYTRKFGKVTARFQLNVSNLFDNDDLIYTGLVTYRPYRPGVSNDLNPTISVPGTFRYLEPRKVKFSVSLDF